MINRLFRALKTWWRRVKNLSPSVIGSCSCFLLPSLRYAGVNWLVFSCSPSSVDQIHVFTTPSWTINKKQIETWTFSYLGYARLMIPWLNMYVLPTVSTIECGVVDVIWRRSPISFEHVCLWCLFFGPHLTTPNQIPVFDFLKVAEQHLHTLEQTICDDHRTNYLRP